MLLGALLLSLAVPGYAGPPIPEPAAQPTTTAQRPADAKTSSSANRTFNSANEVAVKVRVILRKIITTFDRLAGWVFLLTKDILGIVLILVVSFLLFRELRREVLIIEPFSVPKRFEEAGLTAEVIAHRIRDAMIQIQADTKTVMKKPNLAAARDEGAMPDPEIAGTKMGLKAVLDLLRNLTGRHIQHISGDIVLPWKSPLADSATQNEGTVTLYLTKGRDRSPAVCIPVKAENLHELIQQTALAILAQVNPHLVGCYYEDLHEYKKASDVVESILRDRSRSRLEQSAAHNLLGNLFADQKQFAEATGEYEKAIKIDPNNPHAYNNWGLALNNQRLYEEAIAKYKKALKIDPKYVDAYNNWGVALNRQKLYDEAIFTFEKAIKIDAKNVLAYCNCGSALIKKKRYEEGNAKFQMAADLDPKNQNVYIDWALAIGSMNEAIEKYQKAVEIAPEDPGLYRAWGATLADHKLYEEAFSKFEKAVELDPKDPTALWVWGGVLSEAKKYKEAIEQFQKAVGIDPRFADAYHDCGLALQSLERHEEAEEQFRKARELRFDGFAS